MKTKEIGKRMIRRNIRKYKAIKKFKRKKKRKRILKSSFPILLNPGWHPELHSQTEQNDDVSTRGFLSNTSVGCLDVNISTQIGSDYRRMFVAVS